MMDRTIKQIKFNKSSINIIFTSEETMSISESTFTHFYLYKDKVLSEDELLEIKQYDDLNKSRNYVINLLSKGLYTEKDIYNRLTTKKHLSKKDAHEVIEYLKENHFIDDEKYINIFVEELNYKNYGKNKIVQKCYDAGFKEELICKLVFDQEEEKLKAEAQLKKYIKNKEYNYQKLKDNSYSFLLNQGFDLEICSSVVKIIDEEFDFSLEKDILKKDFEKYLHKNKVDLNDYEDKRKVVAYLLRKGYRYEDVKKIVKGVDEDEIC